MSGHVPLHLKEATSKDEGRFVIKIGRTEGNGVDIRVIKHGFAIPREVGQDLSEFFSGTSLKSSCVVIGK